MIDMFPHLLPLDPNLGIQITQCTTLITVNQMEKQTENDMEMRSLWGCIGIQIAHVGNIYRL